MGERQEVSALVLDFGGVISRPWNPSAAGTRLAEFCRRYPDFFDVYTRHRGPYNEGRISADAYWGAVLGHYGLALQPGETAVLVEEDLRSWVQPNPEMRDFVAAQRCAFSKMAILSNMNIEILEYVRRSFDWLSVFDEQIYSFEAGVIKPDRAIFDLCVERVGVPARSCLFVDDVDENVQAARKAGMQALQYTDHAKFVRAFTSGYRPVARQS